MRIIYILLILFFGAIFTVSGQHQEQPSEKESETVHEGKKSHFRLALLLGHAVVPVDEAGTRTTIPTWGIDLEFWISHKIGIGLHNELEMMTFVIERGENEDDLVREYPKILTLDIFYRPFHDLVIFGGIGKEYEVNEDLSLYRLGMEYEIPISRKWDLCPSFSYDSRRDAFNTCSIMLGVGYNFLH